MARSRPRPSGSAEGERERGQQGRRRGARKAAELERASARFQWKGGRSQSSSRINGKTLAFETRTIRDARFRTARNSRHQIRVGPNPKRSRFAPPDLARQEMCSPAVAAAKLQGVPSFRTPCRNARLDGRDDGRWTNRRTDVAPPPVASGWTDVLVGARQWRRPCPGASSTGAAKGSARPGSAGQWRGWVQPTRRVEGTQ
jgi:hypothetical protein